MDESQQNNANGRPAKNSKVLCNGCQTWLPLSCFHTSTISLNGRQHKCKDCIRDYQRNFRKFTKQRELERQQRKEIQEKRKKGEICDETVFFIPNIKLVGYGRSQIFQNSCLTCTELFFCFKDKRDPIDLFCEKCKYDEAKVHETNKSIINFIGNVIGWASKYASTNDKKRTQRNYKKVYERDKYTCQYCGYNLENATKFRPLHIDHIKPWSASGGNAMENMCVACSNCNLHASDKWFASFEDKKEYLEIERKLKKYET